MWPRSARFDAALTGNTIRWASRCDVLVDGETVAQIGAGGNDGVSEDVRLIDGTVSVDRAVVRRTGSVTFYDPRAELGALLPPLRGEFRLWKGPQFLDATAADRSAGTDRELLPIATLVVQRPAAGRQRQLVISGADRMWWVGRQRFVRPFKAQPNIPIAAAVRSLLASKLTAGRRQFAIPDTGASTGAATDLVADREADPAELANDLTAVAGQVLYSDPMGTIVGAVESEPDLDDVVLTLAPGAASIMQRPQRQRDATEAENAVVVVGEAADLAAPVWGYAIDDDPASLTYVPSIDAPNVVPRFFTSPLVRTAEQATLTARTILRTLGISDSVVTGIVGHPALDAGDVLRVLDPDEGLDVLVSLDRFALSLTGNEAVDVEGHTRPVRL